MITYIIIGITVLVSISAFSNSELMGRFLFNPYLIAHRKQWYRFFSHALIHADYGHLLFNMLTLFFFGPMVEGGYEYYFGAKSVLFFILLYVLGIVLSSSYSYEKHKNNVGYNSLGASGAVSAVLFAGILMDPTTGLYLMFIPIPIPGYIFGILYLIYCWYMNKRGGDNIAHDAHFFGAVFGVVFTIVLKPSIAAEFLPKIFG